MESSVRTSPSSSETRSRPILKLLSGTAESASSPREPLKAPRDGCICLPSKTGLPHSLPGSSMRIASGRRSRMSMSTLTAHIRPKPSRPTNGPQRSSNHMEPWNSSVSGRTARRERSSVNGSSTCWPSNNRLLPLIHARSERLERAGNQIRSLSTHSTGTRSQSRRYCRTFDSPVSTHPSERSHSIRPAYRLTSRVSAAAKRRLPSSLGRSKGSAFGEGFSSLTSLSSISIRTYCGSGSTSCRRRSHPARSGLRPTHWKPSKSPERRRRSLPSASLVRASFVPFDLSPINRCCKSCPEQSAHRPSHSMTLSSC